MIKKSAHSKYQQPVIVHGESGCGKTALMAKVAQDCVDWFPCKPVRLLRFLGTSPQSSSIKKVYISLIRQIWQNYGEKPQSLVTYSQDFSFLRLYFEALLTKIDTSDKPLVIVCDSVEQLTTDDYAHEMNWLPLVLPPNVYLIVSVNSEVSNILHNTRRILRDPAAYVEVTALEKTVAREILQDMLNSAGRNLTTEQMDFVTYKYGRTPQALYLKLAFEQAKYWPSYCHKDRWILSSCINDAIHQVFDNLEMEHENVLVEKALGK